MKLVGSSVISEPVEFIFNLVNIVVTKHFFVLSYETVKFILNVFYIYSKFSIYSIPSPIRGSPFVAPHTRRFCSQFFLVRQFCEFLWPFLAEKCSHSP